MPRLPRALTSAPAICSLGALLLVATACGRRIEDESVPEHRIEPCETWCSMMFDPVCPATEVGVPTEEGCVESCSTNEVVWGAVDDEDECAPTYLPYVECLASLPCAELQGHFDAIESLEDVPPSTWSSCGELTSTQLECQAAHY
jgi:hypothetical protein